MQDYLLISAKLFVGLFSLIVAINSSGHRNLFPMTSTDQIQNYVLGGIIGGAIYNKSINLIMFVVIIAIWVLLVRILDVLKTASTTIRRWIDGEPLIVYQNGAFDAKSLKKANISMQDFFSKLRAMGYKNLRELEYAQIEKNGQVFAVKKHTPDLGLLMISNGKINEFEFRKSGWSRQHLLDELKRQGTENIADVFCAEMVDGVLFVYPKLV